jgi:hypothetical protein
MSQQRGEQGGLLIRASDGSLWFMRDNAVAPVKLKEELTEKINSVLEKQPPREFSGIHPDIQKLLSDEFGIVFPWGIIVWWSTRLPR